MADKHEQARDLAEQALDTALDGDREKSKALIEQARALDPAAVEEVGEEVEEERQKAESFIGRSGDKRRREGGVADED